jgi:hypothetical protein
VRILSSRPSSLQSQGVRVSWDLASRTGLHEAVAGVDAMIHCASSFKDTQGVDVEGTRALVTEAQESGEVADRLVAIAELGPLNRTAECGGPQVLTIEEMTQAYVQSRGRMAVVRAEPFSDPLFSALSSDSILTPNHATGLLTWKEFLSQSPD